MNPFLTQMDEGCYQAWHREVQTEGKEALLSGGHTESHRGLMIQ
jgi:hypothetical protein